MNPAKYFAGLRDEKGRVSAMPEQTWADLCAKLAVPVALTLSQPELMALPEKQQADAKATDYIVPAVFKSSPCDRKTPNATHCNLLCVDIDESIEASRILKAGIATLLGDRNAIVWHTARSTPDKPRLRVVVPVDAVPVAGYGAAVTALAGLLGMSSVNRESKVPVQPMYLPVQYRDDEREVIVYVKTDGQDLDVSGLDGIPLPTHGSIDPANADVGDIEYLRAPLDEITKEEVTEALSKIPADCSMQQWVEIGMALKHQFGSAGFSIWDDWSSSSATKYPGMEELAGRWESFAANPKDRVPVTVRSLIKIAVEHGWNNRPLSTRTFESAREWIRNPARSSEELLDQGPKRLAKLSGIVGPIQTKVLISDLHSVTKSRGLRGPTQQDIAKELKRLSDAAMRAASVQPPWASQFVFLTAPSLFYRPLDGRKMRRETVDLIHRAPNADNAASDYLIHDVGIPVVENLRYEPGQKKRVFSVAGVPYINTYRVTYKKADRYEAEEAGALYLEHAPNLFGPYWRIPTNFLSYLVQHPGKKIRWAIFVQSGMGAGKGLIAYICELTLGWSNVQRLFAEYVLEGNHNGWAYGFQLTIIDEIRVVGANRHRVMDKLKPVISDDRISIRNLYEPVQTVENTMNYMLFSNYSDALAVTPDDRRYCAIPSPLQNKEHIDALGGSAYFDRLYSGCSKYAAGLRAFFESWPIDKDFNPEGRAPQTSFLREMSRNAASPLTRAVQEALEDQPHPLVRRDLVSLNALRNVLPAATLPSFSDQALSAILREEGFTYIGRHSVDGNRHSLWVMGNLNDPIARAQERMDLL